MITIHHLVSRRTVLKGAAATAGAAALASCGADTYDGAGIWAPRVASVPDDDPDDQSWMSAPEMLVELGPQDVALPQQLEPAVSSVRVRALHDGKQVAFRLEWDDPEVNDLTVRVDDFRDACAVLLAAGAADDTLRTMGSAEKPATLLHWKGDWQRDVDEGRQGLEAAYPNRSVDAYPPLWDVAPGDVDIGAYEEAGATQWLPGIHVGNPISVGSRTTPVEKAIAYGYSTTATAPTQDTRGRGVRTDRGWRVVLSKPLDAADAGELSVRPGTAFTCAFAVWSGGVNDAGSRKAPSVSVYALDLAP